MFFVFGWVRVIGRGDRVLAAKCARSRRARSDLRSPPLTSNRRALASASPCVLWVEPAPDASSRFRSSRRYSVRLSAMCSSSEGCWAMYGQPLSSLRRVPAGPDAIIGSALRARARRLTAIEGHRESALAPGEAVAAPQRYIAVRSESAAQQTCRGLAGASAGGCERGLTPSHVPAPAVKAGVRRPLSATSHRA